MRKLVYLLCLTGLMSACSIDREPHGSLSSDKILENPDESVDGMVRGVYAQLKTWSDPMHRCGEYAGDNIMIRGASTDAFFEFITFNRTPKNYRLNAFWNSSYKAIAQASNTINLYQDKTEDNIKAKVGECYFVRGMIYFYLVRAYGKPYYQDPKTNLGVPIVNGTPKDVFGKLTLPDRATVEATYQQAIADLKKAEELLPETDGDPSYASKGAAQAMLSKVYLFMSGTYEHPNIEYARLAAEYASKVISSGKYILLSRDEFMKYPTILGGMYANIGGMGWGEMYASAKYLALLDETGRNDYRPEHRRIVDARAAFIEPAYEEKNIEVFRFIKQETNGDFNYLQLPTKHDGDKIVATESKTTQDKKEITQDYVLTPILAEQGRYSITYEDGKTYQGVIDNKIKLNRAYPMFYIAKCSREGENSHLHSPVLSRLGEIYLNRAEAEAKMGNYVAALADLNTIRERAITGGGYKSLDASNAAERIDKERQLELAFQAERSYDVFRNGGSLTRHYPGAHNQKIDILPNDYRVVYFIPQDAIDAYPGKLTQNPTH